MRCLFGVLKRGALSHTFVWKPKITVTLFTPIAEGLTASESVQSFIQQKRSCSAGSRWVAKGVDGTNVFVKADLCGCSTPAGLFENEQSYSPRKTWPSLFRLLSNSAVSKLTRESQGAASPVTLRAKRDMTDRIRWRGVQIENARNGVVLRVCGAQSCGEKYAREEKGNPRHSADDRRPIRLLHCLDDPHQASPLRT
jgi:hypothetical protein